MTIERLHEATLIRLEQEVDGFLGAAFVDLTTGQSLAAHSVQPHFDSSAVSSAGHAAMTAQLKLIESVGNGCQLNDVMVTTSHCVYVYQPISHSVFLYVAADTEYSSPALVRNAVKLYSDHYQSVDTDTDPAPVWSEAG